MGKPKILVVDDEEDILELVRFNLGREGYPVTCANTGEKAMTIMTAAPPDLLVLDLMLPGIDGLEMTRRLKSSPATARIPIIMLTAKGEEADIVSGLELGADDYITKPFSPRILVARVKTVLRRQGENNGLGSEVIHIHDITIHPGRREVTAGGHFIQLTYSEFQILHHLAQRPGWVSTRSQIVEAIRGDDYPVTDRSIDVQIVGLRKKLGSFGAFIQTVRGVGYKFKEKE